MLQKTFLTLENELYYIVLTFVHCYNKQKYSSLKKKIWQTVYFSLRLKCKIVCVLFVCWKKKVVPSAEILVSSVSMPA